MKWFTRISFQIKQINWTHKTQSHQKIACTSNTSVVSGRTHSKLLSLFSSCGILFSARWRLAVRRDSLIKSIRSAGSHDDPVSYLSSGDASSLKSLIALQSKLSSTACVLLVFLSSAVPDSQNGLKLVSSINKVVITVVVI